MVLWHHGTMTDLWMGSSTHAFDDAHAGINNLGQVVGSDGVRPVAGCRKRSLKYKVRGEKYERFASDAEGVLIRPRHFPPAFAPRALPVTRRLVHSHSHPFASQAARESRIAHCTSASAGGCGSTSLQSTRSSCRQHSSVPRQCERSTKNTVP